MEMDITITVVRNMTPDSLVVGYLAFSGKMLAWSPGKKCFTLKVPPKLWYAFTRLHGVTSQKTVTSSTGCCKLIPVFGSFKIGISIDILVFPIRVCFWK
jgi:hypothetical protein